MHLTGHRIELTAMAELLLQYVVALVYAVLMRHHLSPADASARSCADSSSTAFRTDFVLGVKAESHI